MKFLEHRYLFQSMANMRAKEPSGHGLGKGGRDFKREGRDVCLTGRAKLPLNLGNERTSAPSRPQQKHTLTWGITNFRHWTICSFLNPFSFLIISFFLMWTL